MIHIEVYACEVGGVMPHTLKILYAVVASHIPTDMVSMANHYFGYCGSPTTVAYYCYFSAGKHYLFASSMNFWKSSTVGFVYPSLYFLFSPHTSICNFCAFTFWMSVIRL